MRLSEERIKQGLLHADLDVRHACLCYFAESFSLNETVMPVAIESLNRFGRDRAFRKIRPLAFLAQTEETIRWAVEEQCKQPAANPWDPINLTLCDLIRRARPNLVVPHMKAILASPCFWKEYAKPLTHRLEILSWDSAALWRELERICEEGKDKELAEDIRHNEAMNIVAALACQGEQHLERMLDLLGIEINEQEESPVLWMETFMVALAGELRHEAAIPLLIGKLLQENPHLAEGCQQALTKIGTDNVARAILENYAKSEEQIRVFAESVLENLHTDFTVTACVQLLGQEQNPELQEWLGLALVNSYPFEEMEVARKLLVEHPEYSELKSALVTASKLMELNFPELDRWRKELEAKKNPRPISLQSDPAASPKHSRIPPPPPPTQLPRPRAKQPVGRNDPCPCRSGKKYKNCCLGK